MALNYATTDLSLTGSLSLSITIPGSAGAGDVTQNYTLAQFSSSWAANEIPTAVAMLALGREVITNQPAAIHQNAGTLIQMLRAEVSFNPSGKFDRSNEWPETGPFVIFDGYFTGFAYRKVQGKVQVVANLIHWLAGLAFSSSLTSNGHVSNPTDLTAAAVLESLVDPGAGHGSGNYISQLAPMELLADSVTVDLWSAIKNVFCALATVETVPCGPDVNGDASYHFNEAALLTLSRIEGGTPPILEVGPPNPDNLVEGVEPAAAEDAVQECDLAFTWGQPLKIATLGISALADAISAAIGSEFIESYASVSFWDKLVGQFCPMFGMAIVPRVSGAIVVADTPAYNGAANRPGVAGNPLVTGTPNPPKYPWKIITADEYDSHDFTRELHRPLRAVGVLMGFYSQTQAGVSKPGYTNLTSLGGCYSESSVAPGDGMVLFVSPPHWLNILDTVPGATIGASSGLLDFAPVKSSTTPDVDFVGPAVPETLATLANQLYSAFAQDVYVNNMLRGQAGQFSGKLRFDIAPLSIIEIQASTEMFIGCGQDSLAESLYGCVQRVTITINAEAGIAGTSIQLSHLRTATENTLSRTSVGQHPLFGTNIVVGSPLVDAFNFPPDSMQPPAQDCPNAPELHEVDDPSILPTPTTVSA